MYIISQFEKHIWICAFMAVGAKHGGITVGEVEKVHNVEVRELIEELAAAVNQVVTNTYEYYYTV